MRECLRNLIFATLVVPMALWGADPQAGTWKLNLEKSKDASEARLPKSETLTVQEQEGGIKVTVEQVNAQGKPVHVEYSAKYDGKDYPETGSPVVDTIALKRINASTLETTAKKDGKVVTTSRVVISKDGKTRTNTFKGKNKEGEPVSWIVAFDRQ